LLNIYNQNQLARGGKMQEHWHNIYVAETVSKAVDLLRSQGFHVDYNPKPDDPENANGYIKEDGIISSCIRWRASKMPPMEPIPQKAMACIQLPSSDKNFSNICRAISNCFTIIKDCSSCNL